MDRELVDARAQALCDALMAGDMELATTDFSQELRSNLGEVIALLPLPLSESTVESVEVGGKGYIAVLRLVGETETVRLQTRWKDREGSPTVVEVSHLVEEEAAPTVETEEQSE